MGGTGRPCSCRSRRTFTRLMRLFTSAFTFSRPHSPSSSASSSSRVGSGGCSAALSSAGAGASSRTGVLALAAGPSFRRVDWYAYDASGQSQMVLRTYHNVEDGWYLRLQETWDGQVAAVRSTGTDESAVTFSYRENEADIPFLRITKLTGPSREIRATRGGRIILRRQMETIYTAELLEANETWRHGLSEDELLEAFNLITQEWTTSDS